jgi:hypothetical protein
MWHEEVSVRALHDQLSLAARCTERVVDATLTCAFQDMLFTSVLWRSISAADVIFWAGWQCYVGVEGMPDLPGSAWDQ